MSVSIRKCKFCREPGFSVERLVEVNPYYSYNTRYLKDDISFEGSAYLDITESFICPCCGNTNISTYSFNPTSEDLHYFIDKKLEREDR